MTAMRAGPASVNTSEQSDLPLVTIFMFCKNRVSSIRRSIESVLAQTYPNVEYVVQDGASTDGTLEILQSYGDRIKLVSEPDSGHAEAFWKVFQRCTGEFIGSCASDEEMAPNAAELAVQRLRSHPHLGAFCGDGYHTDLDGNIVSEAIGQPFNLVDYLFGTYCPFWPSTFFRRSALADIGLFDGPEGWTLDSLEFEIWTRLGTHHEIGYFPGFLNKYAFHDGQLSNTPKAFYEHIDGRMRVLKGMFSTNGFFGDDEYLYNHCLYNQLYLFYNHCRALKLDDDANLLGQQLTEIAAKLATTNGPPSTPEMERWMARLPACVRRIIPRWAKVWFRRQAGPTLAAARTAVRMARGRTERLTSRIPRSLVRRVPLAVKLTIKRGIILGLIPLAVFWLALYTGYRSTKALLVLFRLREPAPIVCDEPPCRSLAVMQRIYRTVGTLYDARGQVDQAWQMWRSVKDDRMAESIGLQALLKSPTITSQRLLELHKDWAARFAQPNPAKQNHAFPKWDGKRRIKVAYLCSFFESTCSRSQIAPFVRAHDKSRVQTFGYSYTDCGSDIVDSFDVFRVTGRMSDDEFIDLCRTDGIDVAVELSGFSPEHRFASLASRCAPVQIATFNHTGTTGVPNIDWVISDEMSALPAIAPFYTEKIYRIKGSFLCTTYVDLHHPAPAPSPARINGYVTFGCFSTGGKINGEIIGLWAAVLAAVPHSRLILQCPGLDLIANRQFRIKQFAHHGIGADRLDLRPGADRDTIVKAYDDIDISFDTWPYCGGNTLCESLWQGVPAISLQMGERFTSRYGGSLLQACGCGDLVADTRERYVEIAAQLAADLPRLERYRKNLRQMMFDNGFSNTRTHAEKLENAYFDMLKMA